MKKTIIAAFLLLLYCGDKPDHEKMKPFPVSSSRESSELRQLETKYGPLSIVSLRNGKSYTGYVRAKGKSIEIFTPAGTKILPQSQIKSVVRYSSSQ